MTRTTRGVVAGTAAVFLATSGLWLTGAVGQAPFGGADDVAESQAVWAELAKQRLVGDDVIHSHFYVGVEPHGAVLETFQTDVTVNGQTGVVIVKRNYGPAGVETSAVADDPAGHLGAVTVMFQREAGYAPDSKDWFWAKYLPDGSLDKAGEMSLAGRVGGCIGCHEGAPGGDFVFTEQPLM